MKKFVKIIEKEVNNSYMKTMIDLHMHIIPGVDDGATDLEMVEQILRIAVEQGVEAVFATSHNSAYEENTEYIRHQYRKLLKMIKDKKLPIKVYRGCEVLYESRFEKQILENLESGRFPTLNGTRYLLTEFWEVFGKDEINYLNILIEKGFIPVIAHAERIRDLSIELVRELKNNGCLIQVNAYSVSEESNEKIKNRALALLDNKLADFIGSDAHRMNHRPPAVAKGIEYLYANYDEEYVDDILYNNAKNLIINCSDTYNLVKSNIWIDGIMGVITGDALGMPVQFIPRGEVMVAPITTMDGFGSFDMPVGTWSDDGSMTYATLISINEKSCIDYDDIMRRFVEWNFEGKYTPAGIAFDQGNTCLRAIYNYTRDKDYKKCGQTGEWANGNGALMRIMPVCLYSYAQHKNGKISLKDALEYVHQASALTHNHLRSKIACGIYFFLVQSILDAEGSLIQKLQKGMDNAADFYISDITNLTEWAHFGRLYNMSEFANTSTDDIKSSGYVVDSLEAAVWSLITTNSFEEGLLRAVNLGDDTDTIGAIAGGLAGLYYGYNNIPGEWRKAVIKGEEIVNICENVGKKLY